MNDKQQLESPEVTDRRSRVGADFQCPVCSMRSTNPEDVANGYCGACHAFTGAGIEHWIDIYSCGHVRSVIVFVPAARDVRIGQSVVCRACERLVTRVDAERQVPSSETQGVSS